MRRVDDLQFQGLRLVQDTELPRFTADSVLLANFLRLRPNDRAIDLGSGTGVLSLLGAAKTGAAFTGVELREELTALSKESAALNGQEIPYASFEAAYNELLKVTVSGWLPEGWAAAEAPHTTFTFEAMDGETHILALTAFDALHDAVTLDGCTLFYLIRDGMAFQVEQK